MPARRMPARTRYVVCLYFDSADGYLSDIDLLRLMLDMIHDGEAIISRNAQSSRLCLCIPVIVDIEENQEILNAAHNQVYVWIRSLATRGFPFNRRAIFSRVGLSIDSVLSLVGVCGQVAS
ncbi:uncharacterized protein N7482_006411 [Penicillium canariense]|uniref:Uncharacterized protein n=1 Tax=Penicillium canariense TaxID=189055 RepID=A0A9W9LI59_9EURO|nr:uncharacterized protein N7482_006411 [Penicillium canariense]KAJ5159407.1 hypothetical protein N7482_006411 [Penicillium canariense]